MSTNKRMTYVRRRIRKEYWHEGTKRMQAIVNVFYDIFYDGEFSETVPAKNWQAWKRKRRDEVALAKARMGDK